MVFNNRYLRFLLLLGLFLATAIFLYARSRPEQVPPRHAVESLPVEFEGWRGQNFVIDPEVRQVLGDGEFLHRGYRRVGEESPIDLFLAYFPSQRTGSTIHSPKNCLPGSGWVPLESGRIQLPDSKGRPAWINRYLIARGADRELVLYWYQAHGRIVASEYLAKFYLVADSIRINRSDGALVRFVTPLRPGETPKEGEHRIAQFAERLIPEISRYIPD